MVSLFQELLSCYMDRAYVMCTEFYEINPANQQKIIPRSQIYIGIAVLNGLKKPEILARPDLIDQFYKKLTVAS